jgi:acyl-CoA thioester hydrolase
LEHRVSAQLRWRDIDLLGHVNQSVYHELLEDGRAGLVQELRRRVELDAAHGAYVLVHVDLDYHHEVRKDHREVEIVVRVTAVGRSSITLAHEIRLLDGTVAASGSTILVAWDGATRGKRPLTGVERAALLGAVSP